MTTIQVRWFGRPYETGLYLNCPQVPAPVGRPCSYCTESIAACDDGFLIPLDSVFHRACFLRNVYGSVHHQLGLCSCFRQSKHGEHRATILDRALQGLSLRQEAETAVRFHEQRQLLAKNARHN